jgi:hypothetical protein
LGSTSARTQVLLSFDFGSLAAAAVLGALIIIRVTTLQEASHRALSIAGADDAGL